jgi:drug/metabolite transporter (DMT)-like permease
LSKALPLILFTVLSNAAAQILLKRGMTAVGQVSLDPSSLTASLWRIALNPFVLAGFFTFVISMGSHLVVLSRVDLSFAYPFLSLAYVVVTAYAFFFFSENVSQARVAGIALICLGTVIVSRS